jgi:carnosine N-methyltransferase
LVPGAGLGRILYEILKAGYEVQGNELEFCMLMASNLGLNE